MLSKPESMASGLEFHRNHSSPLMTVEIFWSQNLIRIRCQVFTESRRELMKYLDSSISLLTSPTMVGS